MHRFIQDPHQGDGPSAEQPHDLEGDVYIIIYTHI
jgi:hypothetical protein